MLPNRGSPNNPYRIGTSRDVGSLAFNLERKLNAPRFAGDVSDRYRVRVDPVGLGDYKRLVIEGELHRGANALVFDVRLGAATATSDPAILVRTRGPLAESAEITIGAKVTPISGGAGTHEYKLNKPVDALRDIVLGTFASVKESYQTGDPGRPMSSEMISLMIGESSVARWQRARERYMIPTGYQFLYGNPSPGEQIQHASTVQWYIGGGRVDDEWSIVKRQMLDQQVAGGRGMGALLAHGVYARERVSANVYNLRRIAETYEMKTRDEIERNMALVYRGATGDQVVGGLKHQKGRTTFQMERHEVYPFRRKYVDGPGGSKREVWEPVTPVNYSQMSEEEAATFGEQLIEGRLSAYQTFGVRRPGEPSGRNVLVSAGYLATIPTHSGAMMIDPSVFQDIEGVAWDKKSDPIDLPFLSPADLSPEIVLSRGQRLRDIIKLKSNLIGRKVPAGRRGFSLGSVQLPGRESIDLGLPQEQFTTQIQGIKIVIPPYMLRSGEEFRLSKYDEYGDVIPTTALAKQIEEELSDYGVTVETSSFTTTPYLSTSLMTEQSFTPKGAGAFKAGATPPGTPEGMGMTIRPSGGPLAGRYIRIGAATQESKQVAETFGAAWGIQPDVNKIMMLEMVHPQLAQFAREELTKGALKIDRLAYKYAQLMGVPHQQAPVFLFNAMLEKFQGLSPEENEAARVRYGIYTIPGGGEMGPFRVTKEWMEGQSQAAQELKRLYPEEITADVGMYESAPGEFMLGTTGMRFRAVPKRPKVVGPAGEVVQDWEEDVYDFFYYTPEEKGMILPFTKTMALEQAGRGLDVNKDIVRAIAQKFPQWAYNENLLPEQGPDIEGITSQKRAWLGIFNAYTYNTSAIRGDVLAIPEGESSKWTSIGKKEAEYLMSSLEMFDYTKDKMTEEQQIKLLRETFGWQGMFFKNTGRFLPSPNAIWNIDEIDFVKNVGESKAHYITSFLESFKELLSAELRDDPNPALLSAHTTLMGGKGSRIGKVITGGKEVLKQVLGKQIPGAVTGHYGVLNFLQPGEAYVSRQELNRIAENMGVSSKQGKRLLWEHIQREGAAGVFYRYPSLNEETAVMPIKFIGDETIRQRAGFDMSAYNALAPGTIFLDPFIVEPVVGDEDWDPAGWRLGVAPIYDEQGEVIGFRDTLRDDPGYQRWFSEEGRGYLGYMQMLRRSMGEERAVEYSTLHAATFEYLTGKSPLDSQRDIGLIEPRTVLESADLQSWIDARRGTSHRAISAWSIAAAVTGIDPERMQMAMQGMPVLYQGTLESTREAGRFTPLEMLMNTVMFQPNWKTSRMELAGSTGVDMSTGDRIYPQPNIWTDPMNAAEMLKSLTLHMTKMKQLSAEALAAGLANPENFEQNYNQILAALASGPREKWYSILTGQTGLPSFFMGDQVSEKGVLGTVIYGLAAARSMRKAFEAGDTEGTQIRNQKLRGMLEDKVIPFGGEMHSIRSLSENPQLAAFLTSYGILTHQELMPGQGSVPGVSEILDAVLGIPEGSRGSGAAAQMLGVAKLLELDKVERLPGRIYGGGTIDSLKKNILGGVGLQFRASELATLAAGDPFIAKTIGQELSSASEKYTPQTKIRMMSKWLSNLFGVAGLSSALENQQYDEGTQYAIDMGNAYEELIAYWGPGRYTQKSWGSGRNRVTAEGLSLMPRGEYSPKNLKWRDPTTGKRVTGLPDVLGLQRDEEGGEYKHLQELKFGSKRGTQSMVQAAIYREGLMRMYDQDLEGLRSTLENWVEVSKEYYNDLRYGGTMKNVRPPIITDPDWVERAIAAIGRGDIRISTAHGGGNTGRIERKELMEYNVAAEPDTMKDFKVANLIQATQTALINEFRTLTSQTMMLHQTGSIGFKGDAWGDTVFRIKPGAVDFSALAGIGHTIRDERLDDLLATRRYRMGGLIPGLSTTPDLGYNVGRTAILHPGEAIVNLPGFGHTRIMTEQEALQAGRSDITSHHLSANFPDPADPDYEQPEDPPDAADAAEEAAQTAAGGGSRRGGNGDNNIGGTVTNVTPTSDPQGEGASNVPGHRPNAIEQRGLLQERARIGHQALMQLTSEEFGYAERIISGAQEIKTALAEEGIEIEGAIPEGEGVSVEQRLEGALAVMRSASKTPRGTELVSGMQSILQKPAKLLKRVGTALQNMGVAEGTLGELELSELQGIQSQYAAGVGYGAIALMEEQAKASGEAFEAGMTGPRSVQEQERASDAAGELSESLSKLIERVDETSKVHKEFAGQVKDSGARIESASMNLADLQKTAAELKKEFGTITEYRARRDAAGEITGLERIDPRTGKYREVPIAQAREQLAGAIQATTAGEAAERQLQEIQRMTGGGRAARWVRGVFGGFGWMFLQRAFGMGLRGVTEGFEQSEQAAAQRQEILMQELGASRLGAGRRFYERERAMIRKGMTGLGGVFYDIGSAFTGTMAGDLFTGAQTGFGMGLAGTYLASEMGLLEGGLKFRGRQIMSGATLGKGIWGMAGLIGAVGMPLAMQAAYLQNPEETMAMRVGLRRRQLATGSMFAGLEAGFYGAGQRFLDWKAGDTRQITVRDAINMGLYPAQRNAFERFTGGINQMLGLGGPGTRAEWTEAELNQLVSATSTDIEEDKRTQQLMRFLGEKAGGITTGEVSPGRVAETYGRLTASLTAAAGGTWWENVPQEVMSRAIGMWASTGRGGTDELARKAATLMMGGVPLEEGAAAVFAATRTTPGAVGMGQFLDQMPIDRWGAQVSIQGLQAMAQVSNAAAMQLNVPTTIGGAMAASRTWQRWSQTPEWDMFRRGGEVAGQLWETGGLTQVQQLTPDELAQGGRFARFQATQSQLWGTRQTNRRQSLMAEGYSIQQVDAFERAWDQAFQAGPRAMAWMEQAEGAAQQGMLYGATPEAQIGIMQGIGQMGLQGQFGNIAIATRAMAGDPTAIARMQVGRRPDIMDPNIRQMALTYGGRRLPVDVTAQGQVTGMGLFQSYISPTEAAGMFGAGWENRPVAAATRAQGIDIGGRNFVGQWAIRAQAAQTSFDRQMASLGIASQQVALTRQYYLGGGMMGRGLFAIQDDQRALGYEQTEWQFGRQRAQLAMQGQQFRENQALNWQGMQMQRRFTQADWAFQDQTRALQWGWRQEDFQEQVRFMTGRQRRLAERQMGRETIMHGMEEENIERQRSQQKEAWNLEDQRFQLIQEHYKEQEQFQKEGIKAQEDFYKRRRALEEEMVELQRTYMLEQLKLQEQSIGAQAEYAKLMHEHQLDMISMEQTQAQIIDDWEQAITYTDLIGQIFDEVRKFIEDVTGVKFPERVESPPSDSPWAPQNPDNDPYGGVNPYGDDDDSPGTGTYTPPGTYVPTMAVNPWDDTYLAMQAAATGQPGTQEITIYIGNEVLGTYVIDTVTKELTVG